MIEEGAAWRDRSKRNQRLAWVGFDLSMGGGMAILVGWFLAWSGREKGVAILVLVGVASVVAGVGTTLVGYWRSWRVGVEIEARWQQELTNQVEAASRLGD